MPRAVRSWWSEDPDHRIVTYEAGDRLDPEGVTEINDPALYLINPTEYTYLITEYGVVAQGNKYTP